MLHHYIDSKDESWELWRRERCWIAVENEAHKMCFVVNNEKTIDIITFSRLSAGGFDDTSLYCCSLPTYAPLTFLSAQSKKFFRFCLQSLNSALNAHRDGMWSTFIELEFLVAKLSRRATQR